MWPFGRRGSLGARGEKLAAGVLRQAGCTVLARNYRCPAGEADLIGRAGATFVFAEVKCRRDDAYVDPQSAVDSAKRRRYRQVAQYYLHRTGQPDAQVRFDVIAIVMPEDGPPRVTHIPDAFT